MKVNIPLKTYTGPIYLGANTVWENLTASPSYREAGKIQVLTITIVIRVVYGGRMRPMAEEK